MGCKGTGEEENPLVVVEDEGNSGGVGEKGKSMLVGCR